MDALIFTKKTVEEEKVIDFIILEIKTLVKVDILNKNTDANDVILNNLYKEWYWKCGLYNIHINKEDNYNVVIEVFRPNQFMGHAGNLLVEISNKLKDAYSKYYITLKKVKTPIQDKFLED